MEKSYIVPLVAKAKQNKHTRIVLSSYGFESPIVTNKLSKIIPQGDGLKDKTCLVVPYAGKNSDYTFEYEKRLLIQFGFRSEKIKYVKERDDILEATPDYLYFPGGDTFKLLAMIRKLGILEDIVNYVINKNTVYIGASAGAYITGKHINHVLELEDNNAIFNGNFDSLNLISETIICHYNHYDYATIQECKAKSGTSILVVRDDQVVFFENGKMRYIEDE